MKCLKSEVPTPCRRGEKSTHKPFGLESCADFIVSAAAARRSILVGGGEVI